MVQLSLEMGDLNPNVSSAFLVTKNMPFHFFPSNCVAFEPMHRWGALVQKAVLGHR